MIFEWIYIIGIVVLWVPASKVFVRFFTEGERAAAEEYVLSVIAGFGVAIMCPLILPGYGVYVLLRKDAEEAK